MRVKTTLSVGLLKNFIVLVQCLVLLPGCALFYKPEVEVHPVIIIPPKPEVFAYYAK